METSETKTYEFQSEVKQLLDILVYSLYQNKEVFLRELVSNAVDALNKVRFATLTEKKAADRVSELRIDIRFQKSGRRLIVEDNGVGMTRDELIENLGTIAHSGTAEFLKKLAESPKQERLDLIGKFGVGFYSSFMAAEEIHLFTRSFQGDSGAWLWKSKGGAEYSIEETVKKEPGTRIELILKKDEKDFLEKESVRRILARYSRFVPFPIYIEGEKLEVTEAIWTQPKSALKDKDYIEFYKFFENTQEEPETWIHLASDAPVQFHAVLFVPKSSLERFGMFKTEPGVDLYSSKVLIQKESKALLPEYFRFVKGVVDSEDIPLNISRETIQNNIRIEKIRKHILKQLINHLQKLKDKDRPRFLRIWDQFGRNLKEGVATDFDNREKIARLLLFRSSVEGEDGFRDLPQYLERMKPDQKEIYTLGGSRPASGGANPALEAFREKDLEVLYLEDPLDEFVVDHLNEFEGRSFRSAESADIKLDRERKDDGKVRDEVEKLAVYLKTLYEDRVADVRVSNRLVDSPCLLAGPRQGPSSQVEKILKMADSNYQFARRVLEINPGSELIREMARVHLADAGNEDLKRLAFQLLDNMLLREGIAENVEAVVPRIQEIMLKAARAVAPAEKIRRPGPRPRTERAKTPASKNSRPGKTRAAKAGAGKKAGGKTGTKRSAPKRSDG